MLFAEIVLHMAAGNCIIHHMWEVDAMRENSSFFCYRVTPFPALSVYRRGYMTVNNRQKRYLGTNICEAWFVQSGTVTILRDNREETYSAGSVFAFLRDVDVEKVPATFSPDGVILGCSLGELQGVLCDEGAAAWNPPARELLMPNSVEDPEIREKIAAIYVRILAQARSNDPLRYLKNRMDFSELLLLLTEYCRSCATAHLQLKNTREQYLCDMACAYVQEHLSENVRVGDVAKNVGISYSYLHKLFARNMGMPLVEYINREKILLAAQLLQDYACSLSDAGEIVGIPDSKYLSRLFHRFTGMTVTQFKKQHK